MYCRRPRAPTRSELQTIEEAAHLVGIAVEHKQAQEALRESQRRLSTLIGNLPGMAYRCRKDADRTMEFASEGDLSLRAYRGPIPQERAASLRFPPDDAPANREVIRRQEPAIIPDVRADTPLARLFQVGAGDELDTTFGYVRCWLGVPLMVKGEMPGMLTLDHSQPGSFTAQHADLVLTFANQVAVAIEHARLYEHAEEPAVAAERNRPARDLHDAVTQTVFSSSLIAEVLPRIWERNPEEGQRRLEELRELSRGAPAEMRTLLPELRPSAPAEANLGDLLRQPAEPIRRWCAAA